jgi:hypothetical protein
VKVLEIKCLFLVTSIVPASVRPFYSNLQERVFFMLIFMMMMI